jgi:dnd system-associated protein 4
MSTKEIVYVELNHKEQLYDKIFKNEKIFKFAGELDRKWQFLFAMAYGFKFGKRIPLKNRDSSGFVRTDYFQNEEKSIIYAVALFTEGDEEILLDEKKVYEISEEYANAGIRILDDELNEISEEASFDKHLEVAINNIMQKYKCND